MITGHKRYTWGEGGIFIFESNEFIVVKQLTSLFKFTTLHEHLNEFYNQVNVCILFTLCFSHLVI